MNEEVVSQSAHLTVQLYFTLIEDAAGGGGRGYASPLLKQLVSIIIILKSNSRDTRSYKKCFISHCTIVIGLFGTIT